MDQAADREPAQKQHGEAMEETPDAAIEAEGETAEYRPHLHPLQPVVATGDSARLVRRRGQHRRHHQGLHQQGQSAAAQNNQTAEKSDRGGNCGRGQEAGDRLAPAMRGKDPGGIGSGPEKSRLTERDDPGIAQHQIGRQREQNGQNLGGERQIAGKRKEPASAASQGSASAER